MLTLALAGTFAIMHMPPCVAAAAADSPAAASVSAPAGASAPMSVYARGFAPDSQVHTGNSEEAFRNLVPSPLVEAQSIAEYAQLIKHAQQEGRLLSPSDPRVVRVRDAVLRLAPFANKWGERVKDWKWEVNVIRSRELNMYCLPGGKIVVYSGLLDRTHLRDDELGMLLGHEIAHAVREQVRQRLGAQQPMPPGAGASARLFGVAQLGAVPAPTPGEGNTSLLAMKFDAIDETEADIIGGDIASRAGYDPRAAITLWDKLAATTRHDRVHTFIDMHPYSAARRRDIVKRLPDMLALYAKARGLALEQLPDYAGMKAVGPRITRN